MNTLTNKAAWIIAGIMMLLTGLPSNAQVRVPFTQRTSIYTPTQKIYNIKGDFQMIGNTNLTLVSYSDNGNNGDNMKYVDVDGVASTLNSSTATLTFPVENASIPECSNIIYAGLYWIGRAHDNGTSDNTFIVGGTTNSNYFHNNTINGYRLTISSTSTGTTQTATYTFTPIAGGSPVIFKLTTNDNEQITGLTVQTGTTGTPTSIASTRTNYNSGRGEDYVEATLSNPYVVNTGAGTITVNNLRASTDNNTIDDTFRSNVSFGGKILDKSVVYLKHASETAYTTVSASDLNFTKNIYYPTTTDNYMYSAYAEVTDYVKQHGLGAYTVADIALREGDGGQIGFFGGWGMIVVYENSKMKWRDVTIFDGHAYVAEGATVSYELPVSGFRTAQNGHIDMKLGLIAGEGDRVYDGDYFQIRNHANTNWINLSHSGNTTTNFFNSSIPAPAPRNPNLLNNTGVDIAMFNIDNTNNSIVTNNQTSTRFRYGSTLDTYIIPCIAMAVDAYVPELVPFISIGSVNGEPYSETNAEVLPNGEVEYTLELKNPGNERILDAAINIPIPYTATFESASAEYFLGTGGTTPQQPTFNSSGAQKFIQWNIGTIPIGGTNVLARLKFKLKATGDCFLLVNKNCTPTVLLEGNSSGRGETSGTEFHNLRFVHGYKDGICEGEPIMGPLSINIDFEDYIAQNCNIEAEQGGVKVFNYCNNISTTIDFNEIAVHFPVGSRFFNAVTTEDIDGVIVVKPAETATEYTATNTFPATLGSATYYAIPPGASTCWWEFQILVENCNLWYGGTGTAGTDWGTAANWTSGVVPDPGKNIYFATALNHAEGEAQRDLVLDQDRTIGNLTNNSTKKLIIPTGKALTIEGTATTNSADQILIQSAAEAANGSLIFTKPRANTAVQATVEMYSKAFKGAPQTFTDPVTGTYTVSYRWQYFGIPVQNAVYNSTFEAATPVSYVRVSNESKYGDAVYYNEWDQLYNADPLLAFKGYEITQNVIPGSGKLITYKGTLVTGDPATPGKQTLTLTKSGTNPGSGSNIFGNSFTAAIDIDKIAFPSSGVDKTVYIYNTGSLADWHDINTEPGSFVAIPSNVSDAIQGQISSMQGFMLVATAPTPTTVTILYPTAVQNNTVAQKVKRADAAEFSYLTADVIG